jgi:large subunit ribosomal protein L31e
MRLTLTIRNRMVQAGENKERRAKASDVVSREYTIHMTQRLSKITFKERAPRAVREIKKFATKTMNTR